MATIFNFLDLDAAGPSGTRDVPDDRKLPQTSTLEVYGADEETLIRLFRTKMKYALAEAGYDSDAQRTVSELVERNVISCGIALGSHESSDGNLFEAASMQSQLQNLMAGGFNVNSNEPVLMILVDGGNESSWSNVVAMRDASCAVLRDVFHVYPVRVYIARHSEDTIRRSKLQNAFSLALLNVVNTDIGGPGMIQLLDDGVVSSDWEQMVVSSEAWNRTELLWRNETTTAPETHVEEPSYAQSDPESAQVEPTAAPEDLEAAPVATEIAKPIEEPTNTQASEADASEADDSSPTILAEHPAWTELLAQDSNRPAIQHPSWAHSSGGHSLLDLISMQASTVEGSDAETDLTVAATEAGPEDATSIADVGADRESVTR